MDTKDFLSLIFQTGDFIEFRPFWPGSRGEERAAKGLPLTKGREWFSLHKINDAVLQRYHDINSEGYGIYFGVNPRKTIGGGKNEDVKCGRVLCADFDAKDFPNEKFDLNFIKKRISYSGFPTPTFKTNSGGGFHCYWLLTGSLMPEEWREMQERLNATIGADPTIKDPARVMRLPGSKNTKINGNPRDVSFLDGEFYPENIFSADFLKEKLSEAKAKDTSGFSEKEVKAGRPTWIEEHIKLWDLINNGEDISTKGEVMVSSCDPNIASSRTSINIFSGKWEDKSHDSHPELENNGWRAGGVDKFFTGHYMKRFEKEKGKKISYEKASALLETELIKLYGERYLSWHAAINEKYKKVAEKRAREESMYNPSEERINSLREQMKKGELTDLELSLKNPTKSAYYFHKIFRPDMIHRDDFEIYGDTDIEGNEYKFYRMADRGELIEDVYTLLQCSVQPANIGTNAKPVKILVPITTMEPKHVKMILKRLETMPSVYYNSKRYPVPFHKDGRPYDRKSLISFKDYDWNWKTDKKEEDASSDVVLHGRLAYNLIKDAQLSELALEYLKSTFSEETIDLIRNVMLYLLAMQHTEQKMFYIQGKKGRGKGVLFYIIVELIGRHNYSLVTPHILASANGLLPAEGKMLGGCADVHWPDKIISSPFLSTQLLGVINREPVEMKKLYKDSYHTIMDLRLLWGGEILPAVLAKAGIHLTDKIIVMPAKEHVPNWREANDGKLEKKGLRELLTTPEQLAGWCKWALGGDLNDIKNRKEGKLQIKIMSSASSPVFHWIEVLEFDPDYKVGSRLADAKFYKYITSLKVAYNSMIYFCQTKRIDYKDGEPAFKVALESLLNARAEYKQVNFSTNIRKMNYVGFRIPDEWKQKPWNCNAF